MVTASRMEGAFMEAVRRGIATSPSERALLQFLDGSLPVSEQSWVEAHLRKSRSSVRRLFRLMADAENLSSPRSSSARRGSEKHLTYLMETAQSTASDRRLRGGAVLELGRLSLDADDAKEVIGLLLTIARNGEGGIQWEAIRAIRNRGPRARSHAVEDLLKGVLSGGIGAADRAVVEAAHCVREVYGGHYDDEMQILLLRLLTQKTVERSVREATMRALADRPRPEVADQLMSVSADDGEPWMLRAPTIRELPRVAGLQSAALLQQLASDPDAHAGVVVAALEALSAFRPVLAFGRERGPGLALAANRGGVADTSWPMELAAERQAAGLDIQGSIGPFDFRASETKAAGEEAVIQIDVRTDEPSFAGKSIRIAIRDTFEGDITLLPTARGGYVAGRLSLGESAADRLLSALRDRTPGEVSLTWHEG